MSTGETTKAVRPLAERHAKRLAVNRFRCLRIARELRRDGMISRGDSREEIATAIAAVIADEQSDEMELCMAEDGRDWEAFFAALIKFIEMIMPFIMMFMG
jgi:hypothetical protein